MKSGRFYTSVGEIPVGFLSLISIRNDVLRHVVVNFDKNCSSVTGSWSSYRGKSNICTENRTNSYAFIGHFDFVSLAARIFRA